MNQEIKKRIIIVLGMHRSGTSAIARGLKVLGVDLGNKLVPAHEGVNDKGFWEDFEIYMLNEEILNSIDHDWDAIAPIQPILFKNEILSSYKQRAVELLKSKIYKKTILGIKDPRFCILLPFWKEIFDHIGAEIGYIIALRNPISVAHSLEKRDNFNFVKSHYLWFNHVVQSVLETEGKPRVVVDYDLLMKQRR